MGSYELIGIDNKIISFTKKTVSYWKKSMGPHTEGKIIGVKDLDLQRGTFQGDSLSPLIFCISLILITEKLNKLNTGYEEHTKKTKYRLAQKERMFLNLSAISFFGITSNQTSTFENLVQSTN